MHDLKRRVSSLQIGIRLAFAIFAFSPIAHAEFFVHRLENLSETEGTFRLAPELRFYSSGSNFRSTGSKVIPGKLDSYTRLNFDLGAALRLSERLSVFSRLSFLSNKIENVGSATALTASGLGDQTVGGSFAIMSQKTAQSIDLNVQIQGEIPTYDNKTSQAQGDPFMGDGSADITGSLLAIVPLTQSSVGNLTLDPGVGLTYRSDDFPIGIPWSISLAHRPINQGLIFGVGLSGYSSIGGEVTSASGSTTGAGGSFIVNSPKPSHVETDLGLGYRVSPMVEFTSGFSTSLLGAMAPQGTQFRAGLTARFGTDPQADSPKRGQTSRPIGKGAFVQYGLKAKVLKTNERLHLLKIDRGGTSGVEMGQLFDVFSIDEKGEPLEPVARAKVTAVREEQAVMQVTEYYKEIWINEGFWVRQIL